jgi:hypothetical protein
VAKPDPDGWRRYPERLLVIAELLLLRVDALLIDCMYALLFKRKKRYFVEGGGSVLEVCSAARICAGLRLVLISENAWTFVRNISFLTKKMWFYILRGLIRFRAA